MVSFRATFYDGQTSTAHEVRVAEHPGGVRVLGEGVELIAAKDEIRIAPRLGDTHRSITFIGGEKVETADNDAVDALEQALGLHSGLAAWRHRLEQRWRAVLGALAALVGLAVVGVVWGIPLGARVAAQHTPDALAYDLGSGTLEALDGSLFKPSTLDGETKNRVRTIFKDMKAAAPELPLQLKFRKMGDVPNAFALPDGTVVVTDAFVSLTEHDDELRAVLAHEIGHVHHRHGLRMALESSSVALLISTYLGDATQISALLTALPTLYAQAGYSREHETEADTYALDFMQRTGLSPLHFASIMRKLQDEMGGDKADETPGAGAYMSSHPPTAERIARFEEAAKRSPAAAEEAANAP